jgi:ribosome-binding factor A
MSGFRTDRFSEDFKRELATIIPELKDPRIAPLTSIVRVEVTKDLSLAKINISCLEGIDKAKESAKGLGSASGYIKREIAKRLKMRKMPELKFIPDDSIEHGAQINNILAEILPKEKNNEDNN